MSRPRASSSSANHQCGAASPGSTVAVVLGAGQGSRMGGGRNKMLLPLGGRPLLVHSLTTFERATSVGEVVLVAHPGEVEICRELVASYALRKVRHIIAGGASRHQSEWQALNLLRERILAGMVAVVLIHDGARPFVTTSEIAALIRATRRADGALLATPLQPSEVVVEANADQRVTQVFPAAQLWRAQTPQAFQARTLLHAYELAARDGFEGTDTAASVECTGGRVRIVAGSSRNLKITTPSDLARAEAMLRSGPHPNGA